MNIIEVLAQAKLQPKKTFAVLPNSEKITYGELITRVEKISILFQELQLVPGDKILVSSEDRRSLVEIMIAAYRCELVVILIDHNSKADRIQSIITSAQPNAYFIDSILKNTWGITSNSIIEIKRSTEAKKKIFQKIFSQTASTDTDKSYYPACLNHLDETASHLPSQINPSSIAYIIYTSGSTSDPKGVAISHNNLFSHLETLVKVYQLNNNANLLNLLNLYHADGINQGPLLALYCTGTWFCPFKLDTTKLDLIYYGIYKYQITHLFVVPTLLSFFEKYHEGFEDSFQTPDFKFMISVAALLEERLWSSVSHIFNTQIVNIYGLTETVNGSIFCGPEASSFKIGTIGKPVDCVTTIINEEGREVAPNEKGELLLKGEHVMIGYFNNPTATSEVLKDGWLHTGDIATQDQEGFIKIVGRKKSMINSGGFRVQPEEIEEIILKSGKADECKVIGLPDPILTEKMIACIKTKDNILPNELELYKYLRENLEPEKVPHEIHYIEELPRGISGKVQVEELKNKISERYHTPLTKSNNSLETIIKTAAEVFRVSVEEINEHSSSSSISGWDSLNNLILITNLEKTFSIQFSTSEIMVMNSIRSINNIVNKKLN